MLGKYKKKREKEKEDKKKSRSYIQATHDAVIGMGKDIEYLKDENAKTNNRLTEHERKEEAALMEVCKKIEGHTCSLSLETEKIVATLVDRTNVQNGHLADLKKQGDSTAKTQNTLLLIAEGRKSLWKELGIVIASVSAVCGIFFGWWQWTH